MVTTLSTTYFTALHDEAYSLLVESRNYIAALRRQEIAGERNKSDKLDVTLETMRLTTRLTQVMAWIFVQKAVHNNELTPDEAASHQYRLSGYTVCMDNEPGQAGHLPAQLRDLLQHSYELYRRVSRLEDQIGVRLATGGPKTTPPTGEGPYLKPVTTSDQNPRNAY